MVCSDLRDYEGDQIVDEARTQREVQCVCGDLDPVDDLWRLSTSDPYVKLVEECYKCIADNTDLTGDDLALFEAELDLHKNEVCKKGQTLGYDAIFESIDEQRWGETSEGAGEGTEVVPQTSSSGSTPTTNAASTTETGSSTEATDTAAPTGGAQGLRAQGGAAALLAGLAFLL